jgi:hypothetical protein
MVSVRTRKGRSPSKGHGPLEAPTVGKELSLNTIVAGAEDGNVHAPSELLDYKQAAALLNVTPRWVKVVGGPGGILPSVKIGGKYRRYPKAALLAWVEKQQTGGQ